MKPPNFIVEWHLVPISSSATKSDTITPGVACSPNAQSSSTFCDVAPQHRLKPGVVVVQDDVFVFGGRHSHKRNISREVWKFNLTLCRWTKVTGLKDLPLIESPSLCHTKNQIFIIGGQYKRFLNAVLTTGTMNFNPSPLECQQQMSETSITQGTRALNSMNSVFGATCVSYKGQVYLFGGSTDIGGCTSDLWQFDPKTSEWSLVPQNAGRYSSQPSPRQHHTAVVYRQQMWVLGGAGSAGRSKPAQDCFWRYYFDSNRWEEVGMTSSGPGPLYGHSGVVINRHWFIFGGAHAEDSKQLSNDVWTFHFDSFSWRKLSCSQSNGSTHPRNTVKQSEHSSLGAQPYPMVFHSAVSLGPIFTQHTFNAKSQNILMPVNILNDDVCKTNSGISNSNELDFKTNHFDINPSRSQDSGFIQAHSISNIVSTNTENSNSYNYNNPMNSHVGTMVLDNSAYNKFQHNYATDELKTLQNSTAHTGLPPDFLSSKRVAGDNTSNLQHSATLGNSFNIPHPAPDLLSSVGAVSTRLPRYSEDSLQCQNMPYSMLPDLQTSNSIELIDASVLQSKIGRLDSVTCGNFHSSDDSLLRRDAFGLQDPMFSGIVHSNPAFDDEAASIPGLIPAFEDLRGSPSMAEMLSSRSRQTPQKQCAKTVTTDEVIELKTLKIDQDIRQNLDKNQDLLEKIELHSSRRVETDGHTDERTYGLTTATAEFSDPNFLPVPSISPALSILPIITNPASALRDAQIFASFLVVGGEHNLDPQIDSRNGLIVEDYMPLWLCIIRVVPK